jgi:hypothetical protein
MASSRPVEGVLARQLQTATRREAAASEKAASARGFLSQRLAEARAEGYAVESLAKVTGLSRKRVRVLLKGAVE